MILKYAIFGIIGCLIGAYISQTLGYNDGSLQVYVSAAITGCIGGAIGGYIRNKKGKTS